MISDNSIDFDMIIDKDAIEKGTLTISRNDVKLDKYQNDCKKYLINIINASDLNVNVKTNPYSPTFHSSNTLVVNQSNKLPFNKYNYSSTEVKQVRFEKKLITGVKEAKRKFRLLETEIINLNEVFL